MNTDAYVEFANAQGICVRQCGGVWWMRIKPWYWVSVPWHMNQSPQTGHMGIVTGLGALAGYQYPCSTGEANAAWGLLVCRDKSYSMASLGAKVRNAVKQGLERCRVEQIDWNLLLREGIDINRSALERQQWKGDHSAYTANSKWAQMIRACQEYADYGVTAWGALVDGQLAAYAISVEVDRWVYLTNFMSHSEFLHARPNNAIAYTVLSHELASDKVDAVTLGLSAEKESLNCFKRRMGFVEERQPLYRWINPAVSPFVQLSKYRHYWRQGR